MPPSRTLGTTASDEPSVDEHSELLTEHFGFHPRVFIDALVFAANELLYDIAIQFENFAKDALKERIKKGKQVDEMEVEKGMHSILTLMENALDHTFDVLELYSIKHVFGIRQSEAKFMTLVHHRGLDLRTVEERRVEGTNNAVTAKEESMQLQEREIQLQKKLAKAKRVRHALKLANISANRSLARAQEVSKTFSIFFVGADDTVQLPSVLPQSARKLSADASSLLKALKALIATDALGSSLITDASKKINEKDRKQVMDESGASEREKRSWEKGREGYIQWETNRILQSVQEQKRNDVGNMSVNSTPGDRKRRKTEDVTSNDERKLGGSTDDLIALEKRLQQR